MPHRLKKTKLALIALITLPLAGVLVVLAGWLIQFGSIGPYRDGSGRYLHISTDSSFSHVTGHPAFAGFGRFMLPWQSGSEVVSAVTNPLALGKILPRVGPLQPEVVVDGINFLIDAVNRGEQIFYALYSEAEVEAEPTRKCVGLFFLKGKPGAPVAFLIPGGGFVSVAAIQEGFPVARELNAQGYSVFILEYRVRAYNGVARDMFFKEGLRIANEDLAQAMRFVFANATDLQVNMQGFSLWGFSAGGMIAGDWLNTRKPTGHAGRNLPAPASVVIGYSARFDEAVAPGFPPLFMVTAADDDIIPVAEVDLLVQKVRDQGVAVEYLRVDRAGHGFGTGVGTDAENWIQEAVDFWQAHH